MSFYLWLIRWRTIKYILFGQWISEKGCLTILFKDDCFKKIIWKCMPFQFILIELETLIFFSINFADVCDVLPFQCVQKQYTSSNLLDDFVVSRKNYVYEKKKKIFRIYWKFLWSEFKKLNLKKCTFVPKLEKKCFNWWLW